MIVDTLVNRPRTTLFLHLNTYKNVILEGKCWILLLLLRRIRKNLFGFESI